MKKVYHSALKDPLMIEQEMNMWSDGINLAMRADIRKLDLWVENNNRLYEDYYSHCDVYYTEPSWLDGYEKFMDRADQERYSFEEYLLHLHRLVKECIRPLWMVIGTHALKQLPKPDRLEKIKLHGYHTNLVGWNDQQEYSFTDNYDFIRQLAEKYNCVGDFNCGYGNTGRIFKESGKKFIMSDINGKCIYYIAKTLMGYEG